MRKILLSIISILLIILFFCFFIGFKLDEGTIEIKLEQCIDGDTAWFLVNNKREKIRFLGIDSPESTNYIEEYGKDASDYTCNLLKTSQNIYLEFESNSDRYDKYGRLLAYVFVDGKNISELLLFNGYAQVKYIYGDYYYIDDLCNAEYNAYSKKIGIWNYSNYRYEDSYCVK